MTYIAALDALHQRLAAVVADRTLAECTAESGECGVCSRICCPHADTLHFHHDGCPSCAESGTPT